MHTRDVEAEQVTWYRRILVLLTQGKNRTAMRSQESAVWQQFFAKTWPKRLLRFQAEILLSSGCCRLKTVSLRHFILRACTLTASAWFEQRQPFSQAKIHSRTSLLMFTVNPVLFTCTHTTRSRTQSNHQLQFFFVLQQQNERIIMICSCEDVVEHQH